jgi:hypothetical protein
VEVVADVSADEQDGSDLADTDGGDADTDGSDEA